MRLAADDKIDSIVDGYNVPSCSIAVLTPPCSLVARGVLKSGVACKQAMHFKKIGECCAIGTYRTNALPSIVRWLDCGRACC